MVVVLCAAVVVFFASCVRERESNEGRLCSKHGLPQKKNVGVLSRSFQGRVKASLCLLYVNPYMQLRAIETILWDVVVEAP